MEKMKTFVFDTIETWLYIFLILQCLIHVF
jgi:hypothetical protein